MAPLRDSRVCGSLEWSERQTRVKREKRNEPTVTKWLFLKVNVQRKSQCQLIKTAASQTKWSEQWREANNYGSGGKQISPVSWRLTYCLNSIKLSLLLFDSPRFLQTKHWRLRLSLTACVRFFSVCERRDGDNALRPSASHFMSAAAYKLKRQLRLLKAISEIVLHMVRPCIFGTRPYRTERPVPNGTNTTTHTVKPLIYIFNFSRPDNMTQPCPKLWQAIFNHFLSHPNILSVIYLSCWCQNRTGPRGSVMTLDGWMPFPSSTPTRCPGSTSSSKG